MFDLKFVAQFPIEDESLPMTVLHAEAQDAARDMVHSLGFNPAGDWVFSTLDIPVATVLQCVVPVQPLNFSGVK